MESVSLGEHLKRRAPRNTLSDALSLATVFWMVRTLGKVLAPIGDDGTDTAEVREGFLPVIL